MKMLSFILSILVFAVSAFYFINDFRISSELNYLIYMMLLFLLMSIGIVGMLINIQLISQGKNRINYLLYSKFSRNNFLKKQNRIAIQS